MAAHNPKRTKRTGRKLPCRPRKNVKKALLDWSALRDIGRSFLVLAWIVFLFGFFVIAPMTIGKIYGPGWGVLISLLGIPIWATVGVGPMPGLLSGFIWTAGHSVILASIFIATLQFVKSLIR